MGYVAGKHAEWRMQAEMPRDRDLLPFAIKVVPAGRSEDSPALQCRDSVQIEEQVPMGLGMIGTKLCGIGRVARPTCDHPFAYHAWGGLSSPPKRRREDGLLFC